MAPAGAEEDEWVGPGLLPPPPPLLAGVIGGSLPPPTVIRCNSPPGPSRLARLRVWRFAGLV